MRIAVVTFYGALVAFVFAASDAATGFMVLAAVVALTLILRPVDAGRAIADWSRSWVERLRRVAGSGSSS